MLARHRVVAAAERITTDLELRVRLALARYLVLEAEIDDAADAVVERRLPAVGRETPHVVRAHDRAMARAASSVRLQASEVADVVTSVPAEQRSTARHRPTALRGRRTGRPAGTAAEVVDRRVQRQPLELVALEQPVPPDGLVTRDDVLERPVDLTGEDDVDDVLRPQAPLRARSSRRSRRAPRPGSRRRPRSAPSPPPARAASASVRLSPLLTPPPGSSQCSSRASRAGRAGRARARGGSPRRGCAARASRDPRRAEAARRRVRVAVSSPTSTTSTATRGRRGAARSACPARRRTRSLAIGVEQDHPHLAAVAGVDHPRRVDEREAVAKREPGARDDEPGMPLRDLDREPGADRGPLPRPDRRRLARGQVEPASPRSAPATATPRRRGAGSPAAPSRGRR